MGPEGKTPRASPAIRTLNRAFGGSRVRTSKQLARCRRLGSPVQAASQTKVLPHDSIVRRAFLGLAVGVTPNGGRQKSVGWSGASPVDNAGTTNRSGRRRAAWVEAARRSRTAQKGQKAKLRGTGKGRREEGDSERGKAHAPMGGRGARSRPFASPAAAPRTPATLRFTLIGRRPTLPFA